MSENPLEVFEKIDSELIKSLAQNRELALSDGALASKYKYLIAMVIDTTLGSEGGMRGLAQRAMDAGASKEEIAESIRVAHYICGAHSTYTAARGLSGLF